MYHTKVIKNRYLTCWHLNITWKNETRVTCGSRSCPSFHAYSSRVSYQKFNKRSPNAPVGTAYNAYSRPPPSSKFGSLTCDTSQFMASFAQRLPVAANAFSLQHNTFSHYYGCFFFVKVSTKIISHQIFRIRNQRKNSRNTIKIYIRSWFRNSQMQKSL